MIPTGGYSAVGEFGYIEAFKEMMEQVEREVEQKKLKQASILYLTKIS